MNKFIPHLYDARIQAMDRAFREKRPMIVYIRDEVVWVRSQEEGIPENSTVVAIACHGDYYETQ